MDNDTANTFDSYRIQALEYLKRSASEPFELVTTSILTNNLDALKYAKENPVPIIDIADQKDLNNKNKKT